MCVLKILSILKRKKKKKQWINPTLENECEFKRFKACAVYPSLGYTAQALNLLNSWIPRVRSFWIYTTVNFFKKPYPFSPCVCVLKILSIL